MIPLRVAASTVVQLDSAMRHLREAHAVAHAAAPPPILARMESVWQATTSTRAMLIAIWTAYPELDKRDGTEVLDDWQLTKLLWECALAWKWGDVTRQRLLSALETANHFLLEAATAVARTEPGKKKPFASELSYAISIVRTAGSA